MMRNRAISGDFAPGEATRDVFKQARWAWRYAWSISPPLLLSLILGSVVVSVLPAGLAWAGRGLINAVAEIASRQLPGIELAIPWLLLAFGIAAAQETVGGLTDFLRMRLDHQLQLKATSDLLGHAAVLDISWFEDPGFQDVAERAQQNIAVHFSFFIARTLSLMTYGVQIASMAAILLVVDWMSVVIMIAVVIPYVVYRWIHARERFEREYSRATRRRWARYFVSLLTRRESVAEVKLTKLAPHLIERYQSLAGKFLDEDQKLYRRDLLATAAFATVYLLLFYALFARLTGQVVLSNLTVGDVALFAAVISRIRHALDSIARAAGGAVEETLFVSNLADFLAVTSRLQDKGQRHPPDGAAEIEIHDLSFTYPGSHQRALDEVSLHIHTGETLALVGENGAGKTTLVKLIARLYDPDRGSIRLNGIDLREIRLQELHGQIAFVFQEFNRYEAAVWENVAYGDFNHVRTPEAAEQVARLAGLDGWVQSLSDGYQTGLGRQFGLHNPSEGQWQRIAIARALARREANLLILDEATASLDARAEYELFLRFQELSAGRTTILISHRFSTVSMADRIAVLDRGRIVESGTHDQLMGHAGKYAALYELHQRQMQLLPKSARS